MKGIMYQIQLLLWITLVKSFTGLCVVGVSTVYKQCIASAHHGLIYNNSKALHHKMYSKEVVYF
jgi:hypothetical protein